MKPCAYEGCTELCVVGPFCGRDHTQGPGRDVVALESIASSLKELLAFVHEVRAEEDQRRGEELKPKCGYCSRKFPGEWDEHLKTCPGYNPRRPA